MHDYGQSGGNHSSRCLISLLTSQQFAIGFADADSRFTQQLGRMLQHIPYIDDCDTLGQKAEEQKIHKVCVQRLMNPFP